MAVKKNGPAAPTLLETGEATGIPKRLPKTVSQDSASTTASTTYSSSSSSEPSSQFELSVFKARTIGDWIARIAFAGIFVIENIFHYMNFDMEMEMMVVPAIAPLPRELGVGLHVMHIVLGLLG